MLNSTAFSVQIFRALRLVVASSLFVIFGAMAEPVFECDVGTSFDEAVIWDGFYQREKPYPPAENEFHKTCDFRWFGNHWSVDLPVFSESDVLVTLRMWLPRRLDLSLNNGRGKVSIEGRGDENSVYRFIVPGALHGTRESVRIDAVVSPPYVRDEKKTRDARILAGALDSIRCEAVTERPPGVPVCVLGAGPENIPEHFLNVGTEEDDVLRFTGASQREGFSAKSRHWFFRGCSFRWMANHWSCSIPCFPDTNNDIVFRGLGNRTMLVSLGDGNTPMLALAPSGPDYTSRIVIPREIVGKNRELTLRVRMSPPYHVRPGSRDNRELAMALDWISVKPVDQIEESVMAMQKLPEGREPDLPLTHRLRGTESRPLVTDVDAYVSQARLMRCNVMTIGPMNGQHFTAFPTKNGIPAKGMEPDFIKRQVAALHDAGIAAIGWLVFNVQDLRKPEQCQAAKKFPDWQMKFLELEERPSADRVGMCVVSSPWREVHAGILKEAAAQGIDGVFFDGFYLGGIPHPIAPGCVCQWCTEAFKKDTGLDVPTVVDWTDMRFKKWVRWRNQKLIEVALYFQESMREANPDLWVTCNYNMWPFGSKDWDTGIPLWRTDLFGTSQHAYTGRADMEWVMLGYKSRLSHDLSPEHCDIWRTSNPAFNYQGTPEDIARHEVTMRTFMLSGLTYGATPWHGGHISPPDVGIRVHEEVRRRERFFSHDDLKYVGVVISQNTHDFYGHIPDSDNLTDYRDGVLGAWLLFTENHVPFQFVFDNQLETGGFDELEVLFLPNTACLSEGMALQIKRFIDRGGKVIVSGETGQFNEWGEKRGANVLAGYDCHWLNGVPELRWLRSRETKAESELIQSLGPDSFPVSVSGPRSLVVHPVWGPDRRELWIHLLNVSAFYPGGDTGFRGLGEKPVYAGDVASDAQLVQGGHALRVVTPLSAEIRVPVLKQTEAALAVDDGTLTVGDDGLLRVEGLRMHNVIVLKHRE